MQFHNAAYGYLQTGSVAFTSHVAVPATFVAATALAVPAAFSASLVNVPATAVLITFCAGTVFATDVAAVSGFGVLVDPVTVIVMGNEAPNGVPASVRRQVTEYFPVSFGAVIPTLNVVHLY